MKSTIKERPYINPYLGGILLGIVLFLSYYLTQNGLGASAAISRLQIFILDLIAPSHVDRVAYFAEKAGGNLILLIQVLCLCFLEPFLVEQSLVF